MNGQQKMFTATRILSDQIEVLKEEVEAKLKEIRALGEALADEFKKCDHTRGDGSSALYEKAHKPSGTHGCYICHQCLSLDGLTAEERGPIWSHLFKRSPPW